MNLLVYMSAPLVSLFAVGFIWVVLLGHMGWVDLIVVIYLLNMSAVSVLLAGMALREPSASIGVRRHIRLLMACELPFILSIFVPVILSKGAIRLGELAAYQKTDVFLRHPSVIMAFLTAIVCSQAKLIMPPFDAPLVKTELGGGAYTGYWGFGLRVWNLSRAIAFLALPLFLATVFSSGTRYWAAGGIIIVAIMIKNAVPRLKTEDAVRFFLGPMTAVAVIAGIVALLGH
jgi:NADH-quinone oxidoreductase subunit H